MLNRRMPNGMYWWCERGEKISPTRFWKLLGLTDSPGEEELW